jgi:hypothetical protein
MLPAIVFGVKWYRRQRYKLIIDYQYDIGPLVADLKPFAMVEPLDIFSMKT